MPRRQAWWPSAQARYDFPDPVAPVTSTVWHVPDPLAGGEAEHEGAVEAARGLEVEVFDGGVEVEPGVALQALVAAAAPVRSSRVRESRGEAVVEGEFGDVGHGGLLLEGLGPCP